MMAGARGASRPATIAPCSAAPLKTEVALAIGAAKALLIALFFMQLRKAAGLVRLAAGAGFVWASLLYIFSFADILTC